MNVLKLLDMLSDDQFFTEGASRSGAIKNVSILGKKAAIAAIPFGLGSLMTTKAETAKQSSVTVTMAQDGLTDALQLVSVFTYRIISGINVYIHHSTHRDHITGTIKN